MSRHPRLRTALGILGLGAFACACVLIAIGGFTVRIGWIRIGARNANRALLLAALSFGCYAWLSASGQLLREAERVLAAWRGSRLARRFWRPTPRAAEVTAIVASVGVLVLGLLYGAFVASGADAYGYVSQAELWEKGRLHIVAPLASVVPWPDAMQTLAPLGYTPAADGRDLVPIYSPGLPMLMAAFRQALGSQGQYYVVPVLGALAVWVCYALGRRLTGQAAVGAAAALVLATSPPFLTSLMLPWSDLPVTAAWTLALLLALRETTPASAASGVASAVAILIRPNLAPIAVVFLIALFWRSLREDGLSWRALRSPLAFVCGVLPGAAGIAAVNYHLSGSPMRSAYYDVHRIYMPAHMPANLIGYMRATVISGCAYVLIGVAAVLWFWPSSVRVRHRGSSRLLVVGLVSIVWLSYLMWEPYSSTGYFLRFLLPTWPISIVLAAALATDVLGRQRLLRPSILVLGVAVIVCAAGYRASADADVFAKRGQEARYVQAGDYVRLHTPERAVVISMQHSGSVSYYGRRVIVRYDWLDPAWLDRGVAALCARGYPSFILLDDWEEVRFRERFASASILGRLDWAPVIVAPGVHLYDVRRCTAASR